MFKVRTMAKIVLTVGLIYLESRRKKAEATGEGYYGFEMETAAAIEKEKIEFN